AGAFRAQRSDRWRALIEADLDGNDVLGERYAVSLKTILPDAPIGADRDLLVQGVAQALHHAALYLPEDGARIEGAADVLHHAIAENFDVPGVRIDGDFAFVDGEDRDIQCFDEMTDGAARHGRNAWPGECAAAGDRAKCGLRALRDHGDGRSRTVGADDL